MYTYISTKVRSINCPDYPDVPISDDRISETLLQFYISPRSSSSWFSFGFPLILSRYPCTLKYVPSTYFVISRLSSILFFCLLSHDTSLICHSFCPGNSLPRSWSALCFYFFYHCSRFNSIFTVLSGEYVVFYILICVFVLHLTT